MNNFLKDMFNKKNLKNTLTTVFFTLLGSFILAVGDGIFLIPFHIVNGGIAGASILLGKLGIMSVDVWSYILMWGLFLLGVVFLGFRFTLTTLISTIFFPIFLSIILRTDIATGIIKLMITEDMSVGMVNNSLTITGLELLDVGRLLVIGFVGGILIGIGCGITFSVGGSTGGTDIICFILNKFFNFSTSLTSFVIDGMIVTCGLGLAIFIGTGNRYEFMAGLVGIVSALGCSLMISMFYSGRNELYIADVISSKYDEISKFVVENLDRTTTVFNVKGGYHNDEHQMLRVCFHRREYMRIKDEIARLDPKAFVMFYSCRSIEGSGFTKLEQSNDNAIKQIHHQIKKKKTTKKVVKEDKEISDERK